MEYQAQDKQDAKNLQEDPTSGIRVNEADQPAQDNIFRTITGHHLNYAAVRKNHSNRKRKSAVAKHMAMRCTLTQLDEINIGDYVTNSEGEKGLVSDIEVKVYRQERHYYFRLEHGKTMLYII